MEDINRIELNDEQLSAINGGLHVIEMITYTVNYGDNLMKISRDNNSTVEAIRLYNDIGTGDIKQGQTLIIPVLWK
ncbi:MAG: LysM peptidoglycan-binding domain-containing protein [Saccharofermentans sp.]|nr:LysM peptidoglycan-binding domain-containing protein [Saccharofermentans sp.]